MIGLSTPKPNKITIEKDKKKYDLDTFCNEKEIILKCRIDRPLKCYENKYSKTELEEISKIFKGCENINEAYSYLLNSLENKQFTFEIKEESIIIKLNKINIFEFKDIILPQKEIGDSEKIENLYQIQEDLIKEIDKLKSDNENLKKDIMSKEKKEQFQLIGVKLQNGSNYGGSYNPLKVYKLKNGFVKLSGLIKCTLGQNVFQLPENCRPNGVLIFNCIADSKSIRVDVYNNGNVYAYGSGNSWLSLDNIFYLSGN